MRQGIITNMVPPINNVKKFDFKLIDVKLAITVNIERGNKMFFE